jgi:hypothetical protein
VQKPLIHTKLGTLLLALFVLIGKSEAQTGTGINDTLTVKAIIYQGDTIEAKDLDYVFLYSKYPPGRQSLAKQYARLRNAVYVCYPYAVKAGQVLNDINAHLEGVTDKAERRKYIKSREKELKKEFTDPLTNLSIYQGKVLMKLINRETGNNCYEIIKDYKGGLTARFYQTVAFFFSSNLKQPYDASGEDQMIEYFVRDFCRVYGYNYIPSGPYKGI